MKRLPVVGGSSIQRWSRWVRCMVAGAAAAASATLWAQSAVSKLAGTVSTPGLSNTDPITFRFTSPSGIAVDSSGNVFVADAVNNVIRKLTISGSTVTVSTFAGSATGLSGSADGNGTAATFSSPQGITIDGTNILYVADTNNHAIRRITPSGDVTTLAGTAGGTTPASGYVNGTGATARFNGPLGIFADRAGGSQTAVNLFVADSLNNAIRQVVVGSGAANTGVVTTLAGPTAPATTSGNSNSPILFNGPSAITGNSAGTLLWIADRTNHLIRQLTISGSTVTAQTLAGSGSQGYAEGTGPSATFNTPLGLVATPIANPDRVLVSDAANQVIRSITMGGATSLYAGAPNTPGSADGLTGSGGAARFNIPTGIGATADGLTVYVVDTNNYTVRKIGAVTAPNISGQPSSTTVAVGATATFTVTATGTPSLTYQWQSSTDTLNFTNLTNGVGGATNVTTNQLTISNAQVSQSNTQYRVIVSNGVSSVNSNAASLTVTPAPTAPQITSTGSVTFVVSQPNSFTIVATGSPAPDIHVSGNYPSGFAGDPFNNQVKGTGQTTATISGTPLDNNGGLPYNFTITASNGIGSPATQNFVLNVSTTAPPQLTTVADQQLATGGTNALFSVTASGSPTDFTYQWQRSTDGFSWLSLTDGIIIDGATYSGSTTSLLSVNGITPQMNGYRYKVIVKNNGNLNSTESTPVATLKVPPVITSPAAYTFTPNQFNSFNAQASGNPTPTISITALGSLPNGVAIGGSSIAGTPTDSFGSFSFTITATNTGGTAVQNFTLSLSPPSLPFFTSASTASISVGQPVSITFTASGSPTPTFQMFGALPSGVFFNSPTLSGTPLSGEGSPYTLTVIAQNASGQAQQTFTLIVLGTAPVISVHPLPVTANAGATAIFTATATGNPNPTLHWQRQPNGTFGWVNLTDDGVFSGTNTGTLTINGVTSAMGLDQFRLVANNGTGGDVASNPATLTVNIGTVITTIAGQAGFLGGGDGQGSAARFNNPSGLAVDFGGNLYIADTANHVIRKMTPGGTVTTLAGLAGFAGAVDGQGSAARFNSPQGVAVDGAGNVYVADTSNHTIRMVSPIGVVTTMAGLAGSPGAAEGQGSNARFFNPTSVAVDFAGTVYVADSTNHAIRKVLSSGFVTTYAGALGAPGYAESSVAVSARFNTPSGVALDLSGNLYVADSANYVIRRITPGGGTVATIAGFPGAAGTSDGSSTQARFNRPTGIAVDIGGANIYVADTLSSTIRKITSVGDVSTLAGFPLAPGTADGAGSNARFNQPQGIAVDSSNNIYVADTKNHTIRRTGSAVLPQFSLQPVDRAAQVGQSVTFAATATGSPPPGYQWQRQPVNGFGFVNLTNDGTYSGTNTATLTIVSVTQVMNGDQFRVVANNGVSSPPVSNAATLRVGTTPVFTSPTSVTVQAQQALSFTVAVTSDVAVTYTATNLPTWATLNSSTGVLSGTPPDTTGSPFTATITANNGLTATQTLTITVTPAVFPPSITTQPSSAVLNQGDTATFSVTAGGTAPFTYQWRRDGTAIPGATNASLVISNVQPSAAGAYTVVVTNSVGNVTSTGASLSVNSPAAITAQPHTEVVNAGANITFTVAATGGSGLNYQWRKNGIAIPGATGASLTINNISAADAANYDVVVSNALGTVISSLAQLTIVTGPAAPVITAQPASRTVLAGRATVLSVAATGVPAPFYQWRKDGNNINGANSSTLTIGSAQASDAGGYDVFVSNSAGSVTSNAAAVRVISRSYAGYYFGLFSGSLGNFALYVRDDNTGIFLGYLPGSTAPVMSLNVLVNDNGGFSFGQSGIQSDTSAGGQPRAAALGAVTISGSIANDGTISGSLTGAANANMTAQRSADVGATQNIAGFYQAGATASAATLYTIASPTGQAFVVAQNGSNFDGGTGTATSAGSISLSTNRSTINEAITASNGTITGSSTGGVTASVNGASETALARQRLLNISSRARVTSADSVAIAGFVISGEQSKPVLIRAVGPTLSTFGVGGALTTPRLELFQGSKSLAVNTGIGTTTSRAAIDAAGVQAGAFALGTAGTDAAIVTTLPPGAYTAVVSSSTTAAGIALVEVYDLSSPSPGQKLLNIATRASAGTADATLTAGFVVPPGPAKRVLVRGIGPGLTSFGVTGVLATPILTLLNGSAVVATNTNYVSSPDRADIVTASAQVGGFPLAGGDSAMIVTLPPGNYTAQVVGTNNTTGIALIEVYELP